jgi:hypothetical protein
MYHTAISIKVIVDVELLLIDTLPVAETLLN